ncbi:hypothetical protein I6N90_07515 [Paenibacillus sp. GSMTC-2017]|uniref:hypothetical protein n=1 Tax=Paenibacillus sp. GSMTC-2017 TaxID=2794350 RepID=UPI0018D62C02|nr:hypothetical protein [Paenibacillus sp. GSMTC-2017]MBH5317648.1 hypothetical protein [Paenibacillus sp. GSMTC-2017]
MIPIIVSIALIVGLYVWYSYPKSIDIEINAVEYQVGLKDQQKTRSFTIKIDGYFSKKLNGTKDFDGTIHLPNELLPLPDSRKTLNISFDKQGVGTLIYSYVDNKYTKLYSFGTIFINKDFTQVSIMNTSQDRKWSADDGQMIAGPAENREEALAISVKLMKKYLNGYPLK